MKPFALAALCLLTACAATHAANPNDPVEMAAAFGNRAQQYVGMGEVCDSAAHGAYRQTITEIVAVEQRRLGVLSDLADRAYRGHASAELNAHMQTQMRTHGLSAAEFCSEVTHQARADLAARAAHILSLPGTPDTMDYVREGTRPL